MNPADIKPLSVHIYSELAEKMLTYLMKETKRICDEKTDLYWKGRLARKPAFYLEACSRLGRSFDGQIGFLPKEHASGWFMAHLGEKELLKTLAELFPGDAANDQKARATLAGEVDLGGMKVEWKAFGALFDIFKRIPQTKLEKLYGADLIRGIIGNPDNCLIANRRAVIAAEIERINTECDKAVYEIDETARHEAQKVYAAASVRTGKLKAKRDEQVAELMKQLEELE